MGENHPGSNKIVLEFCTRDLQNQTSLTETQRIKLIKLVGPRYNPETDIVKMSSEMFETQAQNKRYLGDLVDTLLAEAKNEEDMFEDVPLDFRHHKFKRRVEFPEEWKLNQERMALLEDGRQNREAVARKREEEGRIVIGSQIIEEAMQALPVRDVALEAQRGRGGMLGKGKGKGKLRALR
jgi:small subunit ribosomal protein S35